MDKKLRFRVQTVLIGVITLLFLAGAYAVTTKKYVMVYFKFGPKDLKIKVFPDNENLTDESHTDYIISKVKNSQCTLYLVKKFPNERELVHYRYRVMFYKPQKIGKKNYDVPIYSFNISFSGDDVVLEYPPSKAVPQEIKKNGLKKKFHKNPGSEVYYLKDYTGGDFTLHDRMRRVKFSGFIKNANGTYTKIKNNLNVKVNLTRLNSNQADDTNITEREREINSIDVPLNAEVVVGMFPYELNSPSSRDRYQLKFLRVDEQESPIRIIHFGEVWNNLYEQALVYQDDGFYLDISFEDGIYNLQYVVGEKEGKTLQVTHSPLTLFLKDYDNQLLQFKLVGRDYAQRYLKEPAPVVQLKVNASKRAFQTAKDLALSYPDDVLVRKDGQISFLPRYRKTLFSIFTEPSGARIRIKRIDPPAGIGEDAGFKVVGQSPIFFDDFEYGRYLIAADWFEKGAYDLGVHTEVRQVKIELSDSPDPELTNDLLWVQKQNTRMPYVLLKYNDQDSKSKDAGFQVEPLFPNTNAQTRVTNTKSPVDTNKIIETNRLNTSTNKQPESSKTNQNISLSTNDSNEGVWKDDFKPLDKIQSLSVSPVSVHAHSILKGSEPLYYVQIAAFELATEQSKVNPFLQHKVWSKESFIKMFDRDEVWSAQKLLGNKTYVVLVVGAFSKSEAKAARRELLRWFPGSFVTSDRQLNPLNSEVER